MRSGNGSDEELRAIGAWILLLIASERVDASLTGPCIGHAEQEWPVMNLLKVLILKLLSIDAFTTRTIALCEVTALDHETLDDTVEARSLVVKRFASLTNTLFASA